MGEDNPPKYKTIKELYEDVEFRRALNDANNAMEPVIKAINEEIKDHPWFADVRLRIVDAATEYINTYFPEMKDTYRVHLFVFPVAWPPAIDR